MLVASTLRSPLTPPVPLRDRVALAVLYCGSSYRLRLDIEGVIVRAAGTGVPRPA